MNISHLYEKLPAPATRALQKLNLIELEALAQYSQKELAILHGMGPKALKIIESELVALNLSFLKLEKPFKSNNDSQNPEIDTYIQKFPASTQSKLNQLRAIIKTVVPEASEKIAYQMPTFCLFGNLVHFAAYERHIGFYPAPSGIKAFQAQLKVYKSAKGSVQFPLDQALPLELIQSIVKFRVAENKLKFQTKLDAKAKKSEK
jgi:uncharacterized protein YdhG (YjbR/CyaY superfamily)